MEKKDIGFSLLTTLIMISGIYLEVLDLYGHRYGVNSVELNNMLADVDKTLLDFRRNLSSLGLNDDVNIVIFSDHGMVNITKIVNITDILNISDIKIIFQEPSFLTIWPVVGQVDKVCNYINNIYFKYNNNLLYPYSHCIYIIQTYKAFIPCTGIQILFKSDCFSLCIYKFCVFPQIF